jgi:AbrB family looped-hinge helix DNA binding protein
MTVKGQVTIPRRIREHLGVAPHDEVDFVISDGHVILVKGALRDGDLRSRLEKMRGCGNRRFTTEEIMRVTRGYD